MEFKILSEEEFRNFSMSHKYKSFFQTVETGLLREKNGFEKHFVGLVEGNKIIAATLLVSIKSFLGKKKFYAPRGYLIDFQNFELLKIFSDKLKKYVKNNNGFYIKIDPYIAYRQRDIDGKIVENGFNNQPIIENLKSIGYKHYGFTSYTNKTEQVRWMFVLDIENKTEDEIFKELKQGTRTRINKTIKYNYLVRELKKDELNIFVDVLKHTGNRKGFESQSLSYFENLYDIYTKNNMVKFLLVELDLKVYKSLLENNLLDDEVELNNLKEKISINQNSNNTKEKIKTVEKNIFDLNLKIEEANNFIMKHGNNINLSSAMFITYGDEIVYLSSGNYEEFISLNGQYSSQWEIIKYGIKNKFKKYNFYGISGNFDPNDSQYGIYNFKRGFNGYVVELIGEFDLPTSSIYHLYKLLSKIKRVIKR